MCENHNDTHFLLEPAHGLLFADAVPETDATCFPLLVGNAEAGSAQNLKTKRNCSENIQQFLHYTIQCTHISISDQYLVPGLISMVDNSEIRAD